ncbi:MAG TPA: hypothetical protein VK348_07150 [Planctomycetota bacterium]|nr:hypothetical protein [Planctomycetota bacterium]
MSQLLAVPRLRQPAAGLPPFGQALSVPDRGTEDYLVEVQKRDAVSGDEPGFDLHNAEAASRSVRAALEHDPVAALRLHHPDRLRAQQALEGKAAPAACPPCLQRAHEQRAHEQRSRHARPPDRASSPARPHHD